MVGERLELMRLKVFSNQKNSVILIYQEVKLTICARSFPAPCLSVCPSPGTSLALKHLWLTLPAGLAWKEDLQKDTGRSERSQLLKLGKWEKKGRRVPKLGTSTAATCPRSSTVFRAEIHFDCK